MFKFKNNKIYNMPPYFGGSEFDPNTEARINDFLQISYTQSTDGNLLANYLPKGFSLLRPELNIDFVQFREVDFLAGGAYNVAQATIPAYFHGKHDQLEGSFNLVVWENKTTPIIGGREESGIPKIYADIEDFHIFQGNYFTNVSFEGNTFLRMKMMRPQPLDDESVNQISAEKANINAFGWRYICKIGAPGADLSQPTLYPQFAKIQSAWIGKGSVEWTKVSYEQNERQYHIINSLASLPIIKTGPVIMTKGSIILKPHAGRVLI